jgi:hypothetical protein
MTTRNNFKTILTLATVAMAVFVGAAQAIPLRGQLSILTAETLVGNNPATGAPWAAGDQYRFAFHTSATITAVSADIATYNTWVQGLANTSTAYNITADDGVTWKAIGSTATVDARDNTSTNPTVETGCAIFLLDGSTLVANNYADLWDGEIQHIINLTEQGTEWAYWPWTGTEIDGTARTGGSSANPLGSTGEVGQGNASVTTEWIWRVWTMDPPENLMPMYALSEPLVIVVDDPNLPSVDAGVDMITWSGQQVQLDPNIVEKEGSDWTNLTCAWSADPEDCVEFSYPNALAPMVTITKSTGNPSIVTLTLAVNNEGRVEPPVTDTMTIEVYDDSCLAAKAVGPVELDPTDIDGDCITAFEDFALMAITWFDDYSLKEPVPK